MSGDSAGRLWAKGLPLDGAIHRFTVGQDYLLDRRLVAYDTVGSAAHARMLAHTGLLSAKDAAALVGTLKGIADRARGAGVEIRPEQEDAHTAIEALLVDELGEAGKRLHLGRSRNDQVILALRLFMRQSLLDIGRRVADLADAFLVFARIHADLPMPGYTHLRRAMPSSFGLWAAAFAAGLEEELEALQAVYARLDRCPLGAAAGFGVPLPIDREYVAGLLGFSRVQISPVDVINSRGRHESAVVWELCSIGNVLEKFLWDVALYSMPEFGFLRLPDAFTTGSSIMPQKRNPDVVELARAYCRELRGHAFTIQELAGGLPSNYHRDHQLLKRPLFAAIDAAHDWLEALIRLLPGLEVNAARAAEACTDELYAAHRACALASDGVPFREAYRQVAAQLAEGRFNAGSHEAAIRPGDGADDIGLEYLSLRLQKIRNWFVDTDSRLKRCEEAIWQGTDNE